MSESGRRKREGNEENVLVLHARSTEEALKARDVLAGIGIDLEVSVLNIDYQQGRRLGPQFNVGRCLGVCIVKGSVGILPVAHEYTSAISHKPSVY